MYLFLEACGYWWGWGCRRGLRRVPGWSPAVTVCVFKVRAPFPRPASMWLELAVRLQGERAAGFLRSVSVLNL